MKYSDLESHNRNYINGKISQYVDAYIRQHKVWTPDQMLESFADKMKSLVEQGQHTICYEHGVESWTSKISDKWLLSKEGQTLAYERMTKKYKKDKPIAIANSPIVERVRFGYSWDNSKSFDIGYGLKNGYNFIGTEELKKYPYKPWTISHVEQQLQELYKTNNPSVLNLLSTSPIEQLFYQYWLDNYYSDKDNPALIPEVCGFRAKFYYYEYKERAYATRGEVPEDAEYSELHIKNFRYDFFISNTKKNKIALIEIDGHETHKTKNQRIIDSIKRNEAANLNIPVVVFTGTQIHSDIASCFRSINDLLTK